MNNIFYTKIRIIKLFNLPIFKIETIYNENEHDTDFDIVVKQDYYDKEFKTNEDKTKP